jgi:chromosome segregation ATPase
MVMQAAAQSAESELQEQATALGDKLVRAENDLVCEQARASSLEQEVQRLEKSTATCTSEAEETNANLKLVQKQLAKATAEYAELLVTLQQQNVAQELLEDERQQSTEQLERLGSELAKAQCEISRLRSLVTKRDGRISELARNATELAAQHMHAQVCRDGLQQQLNQANVCFSCSLLCYQNLDETTSSCLC